jgi:hydroxymethylglutaryl-CoA lyase
LNRFPATFSLHLHNTRGMGLANTLAGMDAGIGIYETSAGGLGGCPFAPGAAGNTATEDLVNMLESMGINTGINLVEYLKAVVLIKEHVKKTLSSSMITARQYDLIK